MLLSISCYLLSESFVVLSFRAVDVLDWCQLAKVVHTLILRVDFQTALIEKILLCFTTVSYLNLTGILKLLSCVS